MEPLGIGFIGAGFAADLHAHALAPLRGTKCELVAVASRTRERAEAFAKRFGIPHVYTDHRALLARRDIGLVTLPVVTSLHHVFAIDAAEAGKHVIVEKPLTGCFADGDAMSRRAMLDAALQNADAILDACRRNRVTLGYAENFVYAPPVAKLRRLLAASGGTLLDLRAEESHSGSHAAYSRRWATAGGGSLLRMGSHPIGAVIHLKHYEGQLRQSAPIRVKSVVAEIGRLTRVPAFQAEPRKWLAHDWHDVEDWSAAILTFEDGTKATVLATDVSLGGVKNLLTAYLSNGVVEVNINPNTALRVYAPDGAVWGEEYLTEKVETRAGWQFPSPDEDWMRGYPQELADFVDAVREGREPLSGALLARETVEVIYAAYVSAQEGRRVELAR
ncbi:MAG TPA: Gfo/Idh/MocA family oxidoreductase [Methylomirabilota bacterium]|jgi:predicted dehydrogenase|nr:Gfo/Idh/MocA family oxidoreductase [Methylomirabilota bacterium]